MPTCTELCVEILVPTDQLLLTLPELVLSEGMALVAVAVELLTRPEAVAVGLSLPRESVLAVLPEELVE